MTTGRINQVAILFSLISSVSAEPRIWIMGAAREEN